MGRSIVTRGNISLPNMSDELPSLSSGAAPVREAGSAGGGTEVPKGW